MSFRAFGRTLAWTGYTIVTVFAFCEIGMRSFWPQENLYLFELRQNFIFTRPDFDDVTASVPVSFRRLQNAVLKFTNRLTSDARPVPRSTFVRTNAQGLRGNEEIREGRGGNPRLLVLGDSISFGWTVDREQMFLSILEERRPDLGHIVNCSVVSANTVALEKIYRDYCSRFEAHTVLLQIAVARERAIPDFLWSDFGGADTRVRDVVWNRTGIELGPVIDYEDPRVRGLIEASYRPRFPLYRQSHVVRFIENSFLLSGQTERAPSSIALREKLENRMNDQAVFARMREGDHPTLHAISRIRAEARARGAGFAVMIFPAHSFALARSLWDRPDLAILLSWLKREEVPVLDLRSEFLAGDPNRLYWPWDEHPNLEGNEIIARRLGEFFKRDDLFGESH